MEGRKVAKALKKVSFQQLAGWILKRSMKQVIIIIGTINVYTLQELGEPRMKKKPETTATIIVMAFWVCLTELVLHVVMK